MPSSMPPITAQPLTPVSRSNSNKAAPVAVEDGFSNDEIAQFAELLCSPKKAPPVRYQCHICYQNGHYISDCPMVNFFDIINIFTQTNYFIAFQFSL